MEVTPEMRAAVYADDCVIEGHIISIENMMSNNPHIKPKEYSPEIRSENEGEFPHIFCRRCKKVWLIIEDPGTDYEDAETKLQGKLKATDELAKKITENRKIRKDKKDKKDNKEVGHGHAH